MSTDKEAVQEMIANGTLVNRISSNLSDQMVTITIKNPDTHKVIPIKRLQEMAKTGYATSDEVQTIAKAILMMARRY